MKVDYIIVGLGLAGLAFSEELIAAKKTFIVFEDSSQNSSLVAGGVFNPVVLKRFTPVWNGHQQLKKAIPFYQQLEQKFNEQFVEFFPIKKALKSIEDQNNWFEATDKPMLDGYIKSSISNQNIQGIIADFGFGELTGTGRVLTEKLIKTYRNYLLEKETLLFENFDYSKIMFQEHGVVYKEISAGKIVFCEGFGIVKNPFFNYLPLKEAKGELITIYAPELAINFLLKSTLFVLPLGNHYYKVGATFNWKDKTAKPSEEGKQELIDKLQKVLTIPYIITNQSAGIRPTVKDRRPLVGVHSAYKQLVVLNGLGTRGVMISPTVASNLFHHLENDAVLDTEIDIKRFD